MQSSQPFRLKFSRPHKKKRELFLNFYGPGLEMIFAACAAVTSRLLFVTSQLEPCDL